MCRKTIEKTVFRAFNLLTSLIACDPQCLCDFTIGRLTLQTSLRGPFHLPKTSLLRFLFVSNFWGHFIFV